MTDLSTYRRFYFLGIGGIGMSGLARYFKAAGFEVAGYDRTPSDITEELEAEGVRVHFEDDIKAIPAGWAEAKDTLVVYTPAVPQDHKELNHLRSQGLTIKKRAEVLAAVTSGKKTIAVAGTHGKTSTSTLISHILKTANVPFFAFLGGISTNYGTNFIAPEKGSADLIVVEADEFDRSFLQLNPDVAIITAVESDHLDIYGTYEELERAYSDFGRKVKSGGKLILHDDVSLKPAQGVERITYSARAEADCTASNIHVNREAFHFDAQLQDTQLPDLQIGVPGVHNIENSLAAMTAVEDFIADKKVYYQALETYRGVHRRFEQVLNTGKYIFIDDYAHHPTEIRVTLETIRSLYPDRKMLAIFQPHLFSRTKDLAAGFAESLSLADEVILLPIYPARELPMEGVTSAMILDKVKQGNKKIVEKDKLTEAIAASDANVIVTIGAGDIDRLVQPIKELLEKKGHEKGS